MSPLSQWNDPEPEALGDTPLSLLERLRGPTVLRLSGRGGPTRVVTTLLHGNEPSGLFAIHRLLREGLEPAGELLLCIANVEAARTAPWLTHRARRHGRDLNRCFAPPFEGHEGALARALVELLTDAAPELVVDLHNTSGRGPSYAVCSTVDAQHQAIASLFVERIVHTELRLATVMEAAEDIAPSVTIECGGAGEQHSHEVAAAGIRRLAGARPLATLAAAVTPLPILTHPIRVELVPDARVAYGEHPVAGVDLTLDPQLDLRNFGRIAPGDALGFLGPRGLSVLRLRATGEVPVERLFGARDGRLVAARALEPLMVTVDPRIAVSDCLMYVAEL